MITINKEFDITSCYNFSNYSFSDLVFFDIETTGLNPFNSFIYLIGCVYYRNNKFHFIQWFADNTDSEKEIIESFFEFIKNYKLLINFNGNYFDIPFVLKRCSIYQLNYNFNNIQSVDLYKEVLPYKKILQLENYKQKTIEKFLGINRKDKYSGGELIQVYNNYLKCKNLNTDNNLTTKSLLNMLLLHNEDDIKGLVSVSNILVYRDLFTKFNNIIQITVVKLDDNNLIIEGCISKDVPQKLIIDNSYFHLLINKDKLLVKVPIYKGKLKYFYENYKDYYYLINEDYAIHKSVATYVDKDFKVKCKANNCYIKKTGNFIPQLTNFYSPYFKNDYKDKISYIEINSEILNNKSMILDYINNSLKTLS